MSYNYTAESKKYNRRIDPQSASEDDISGYIKFKTELYKREEWLDEDLWETFTYDFEKFNLDNWKMAEKGILQSLRKTLRSAGVNVKKDEVVVWNALNEMTSTTKFPPWTEDQIRKSLRDKSFNFTSGKIQWLLENNFGRQESNTTSESAKIQSETCKLEESELPKIQNFSLPEKQLYDQQPNFLADIGRQSGNLSKIYTENMKYSGENDSFTYKLMIFNDNCSRAGVTREKFSKVFPIMLKGLAFDYYYANIGAMPQTFEGICKMFEEYFEGEEYKRGVLTKWNNINLQSTINQNAGKSIIECLQAMVSELRILYKGLSLELQTEKFFHNKIIIACQGVKACSIACTKPASSVASLLEELRSGITTFELSNPTSASPTLNTSNEHETFYTDRKFRRRHDINNSRPNERRFNSSIQPSGKKCFVCHKGGCWSSRHTQEERDESYQKYKQKFGNKLDKSLKKRFEHFVAEYEGDELDEIPENNLDDENFDVLLAGLELHYTSGDEIFLTSAGPIDGKSIISNLENRSFLHGITGKLNTNQSSTIRYGNREFYGIMIDTGAAKRSTAGYNQYLAFNKMTGTEIDNSTAGKAKISFGIGSTESIGSLYVNSPIGLIEFHVLHADTPFLLSIADMDRLNVYYNNISNKIVTPLTSYPVIRRFGHPFLLWKFDYQSFVQESILTDECFLTNVELQRLHRRFGHPSVDRLRRLLERSGHDDFDISYLNNLTKFCKQCQLKGKSPGRFKFNLRDELNFNYTIIIDIMYINGKPILHVVDEATRFQAARWLENLTSKHTWDTLRHCWIDTYVGPPDWIISDAGTNFVSKEFVQHASSFAIRTKSIPVEAHWSIGIVERYHHILRRAYEIVVDELKGSGINKELALQIAVKAVKDSAGPDGLVPTLLVFGTYPRMSENDPPAPTILQRSKAIQKAMEEISKIRAQKQIANALNQRNGPSTISIHGLTQGSDVLVWREGNSGKSGKWKGPYKFLSIDGETCKILLPNGITDFRSTSVKPFFQEAIEAETSTRPKNDVIIAPTVTEHENNTALHNIESKPQPQPQPRRSNRQKAPRKLPYDDHLPADISVLLQHNYPDEFLTMDISSPTYTESKRKEIDGLMEKGVFKVVPITSVPKGTRIFNSRFVNEIKNSGTDKAIEKSRLVVQAYKDNGKDLVLTQSPTIQRVSQRIILLIAASLRNENEGINLYLRDISQAYVQSTTSLARKFFVRPPSDIELPPGTIWQVIRPLYGIPEAGNHWYNTYHHHHLEKLNMTPSTFDSCLLHTKDDVLGLVGLQTDDTLILADSVFASREEEQLKEAKFLAKDREKLTESTNLQFNGSLITLINNSIYLSQERQCKNIRLIGNKDTDIKGTRGKIRKSATPKDQYIAQRARGAYVASICQPEASFDLSFAAQCINPMEDDAKFLNKRLKWQINNAERGIKFVPLDLNSLQLVVFIDASFAGNKDFSSQIGYVIVMTDKFNNANIIHWSSIKCKRITRSVLASELYAMAYGFDASTAIKSTVSMILRAEKPIPLVICTDSKSLYDCLVKLGTTREKRLMIDIMSLRQSYERREITEIRWIDGNTNPADAMTKSNPCQALKNLIETNRIELKATEWVDRE